MSTPLEIAKKLHRYATHAEYQATQCKYADRRLAAKHRAKAYRKAAAIIARCA